MHFVTEYRTRAEECRMLARRAIIEEHRKTMMDMAHNWEALAVQREAIIKGRPDMSDVVVLPWRLPI